MSVGMTVFASLDIVAILAPVAFAQSSIVFTFAEDQCTLITKWNTPILGGSCSDIFAFTPGLCAWCLIACAVPLR